MRIIKLAMLMALITAQAWALNSTELDALQQKLIMAESSNNPDAIGDHGKSRGLMQIQKATWKVYSKEPWDKAFDPNINHQVGRHILEDINDSYGDKATEKKIAYTYNTGRYCFGDEPCWPKKHPNKIYREIYSK
jgi:soluble lytic murein transglycosylase-like protein